MARTPETSQDTTQAAFQNRHFVHGLDGVPHHAKAVTDGIASVRRFKPKWMLEMEAARRKEAKGQPIEEFDPPMADYAGFAPMPEIVINGGNQAEQELTGPFASSAIEPVHYDEQLGFSFGWLGTLHHEVMRDQEKPEGATRPQPRLTPFFEALEQRSARVVRDPGRQDPSIPPMHRSLMRYSYLRKDTRESYTYGLTSSRHYYMLNAAPPEGQIPMSEVRRGEEMLSAMEAYLHAPYMDAREFFPEGSADQEAVDRRWRQVLSTVDVVREQMKQSEALGEDPWTFTRMRTAFGQLMAARLEQYVKRNHDSLHPAEGDTVDRSLPGYLQDNGLVGVIMGDQTGAHFEWDGALKQMNVQEILTGDYRVPETIDSYEDFRLTSDNVDLPQWKHVEANLRFPDEHRQAYNSALREADAPQHDLMDHETLILVNTAEGRFALQQRQNEAGNWEFALVPKDQREPAAQWTEVGKQVDMATLQRYLSDSGQQEQIGDEPVISMRAIAFLPSLVYAYDEEGRAAIGIQHRGSSYKGISAAYARNQREMVPDPEYQLPPVHVPGPEFSLWQTMAEQKPDSVVVLPKSWQNVTGYEQAEARAFAQDFEAFRGEAAETQEALRSAADQRVAAVHEIARQYGIPEDVEQMVADVAAEPGALRPDESFQRTMTERFGRERYTEDIGRFATALANITILDTMQRQLQHLRERGQFGMYTELVDDNELGDKAAEIGDTLVRYQAAEADLEATEAELTAANKEIRKTYDVMARHEVAAMRTHLDTGALQEFGISGDIVDAHIDETNEFPYYSSFTKTTDAVRDRITGHFDRALHEGYIRERHPQEYENYQQLQTLRAVVENDEVAAFREQVVTIQTARKGEIQMSIGMMIDKAVSAMDQIEKERATVIVEPEEGKRKQKEAAREGKIRGLQSTVDLYEEQFRTIPDAYEVYAVTAEYNKAKRRYDAFMKTDEMAGVARKHQEKADTAYDAFDQQLKANRRELRETEPAYRKADDRIGEELAPLAKELVARIGVLVKPTNVTDFDASTGLMRDREVLAQNIDTLLNDRELRELQYRAATVLAHINADLHDVASADWGNTRQSAITAWLIGGESFVWHLANNATWRYEQVY